MSSRRPQRGGTPAGRDPGGADTGGAGPWLGGTSAGRTPAGRDPSGAVLFMRDLGDNGVVMVKYTSLSDHAGPSSSSSEARAHLASWGVGRGGLSTN